MDDFRDIPGFPNYQINSRGDIYNKSEDSYPSGTIKYGNRQYTIKPGDIRLTTSRAKTFNAQRLVALAFLDIPLTHRVVHKDGDNLNNHWRNLETR